MTADVFVKDGRGERRRAGVDADNCVRVAQYAPDLPPFGQKSRYRFLGGLLGSTGLGSGTTSQNVDGSTTPQEFYVGANQDYDIYIMGVSILIADTGIVHNNFGTLSALTTGWDLILNEGGEDTILVNKAQTNGEVIIQTGHSKAFGDGAESWELINFTATEDACLTWFGFNEYIPGGLRIARGSQDQLRSVVNDDLTGLTEMQVRIFGYRHYPLGK